MKKTKKLLSLLMTLSLIPAHTPILVQSQTLADGDVVWEENFEDSKSGDLLLNDSEHWAKAEARGSDGSKINLSAVVAGNEGHKYLEISANVKDGETVAKAATAIVGTQSMSSIGLEQDTDFTVSYDFKSALYDESTMCSNSKYTEYYHSISDSSDYADSPTLQMFFHHKAATGNKTTFFTDSSGKAVTNLNRLCGSDVSVPSGDLYTAGWNSIQWVVHASSTAQDSYADLYLNGVYRGSIAMREGEFARCLVFGINFNPGIQSGTLYIDNIKITKGAYDRTETASKTTVNALTTGFEECIAAENGSNDISVYPGLAQREGNRAVSGDSDYITYETVAGAFGKSETDKALHITNTVIPSDTTVSTDSFLSFGFDWNGVSSTKLYETGDSQEISFDFAYDKIAGPLTISAGRLYSDTYTQSVSTKVLNLIQITTDNISILNGDVVFDLIEPLNTETWYNARVIFSMGSDADYNSVTVYLTRDNGSTEIFTEHLQNYSNKVGGNITYRGIAQCWLHYKHDGFDKSKGVWYDNFTIKSYIGGETFPTPTDDERINMTLDKETGKVTAEATVLKEGELWNGTLVLAVYDSEMVLKNIKLDPATDINGSHTFSVEADTVKNDTVKAMLIDGFGTMKPLLPSSSIKRYSEYALDVPSIFSSNSIIQRDTEFPVWGRATTDEEITVTVDGNTYSTTADENGDWSITSEPVSVEDNPHTITVSTADDTITYTDILAGDVWLCSGQSNMAYRLSNIIGETGISQEEYEAEINGRGNNPEIKVFKQNLAGSTFENFDVENGYWRNSETSTVGGDFYAVAYYFAQKMYEELNIPIGILNCAYSGAPIQAFISQETLKNGAYPEEANYTSVKEPSCRNASRLFNKMIAPILKYPVSGILWYQGEGNARAYAKYAELQREMVESWRAYSSRNADDVPFIFAQLSAYDDNGSGNSSYYPYLREAQYNSLNVIPNSAMVVTMDVGEENDIHPKNKAPVGERMALTALNMVYGMDTQYKYPVVTSYEIIDGAYVLTFNNTYDGLKIKDGDSTALGFSLCGEDGVYYDAIAEISGNTVTVTSENVTSPIGLRYGFKAYEYVNLYNSADIPAMPFRIE